MWLKTVIDFLVNQGVLGLAILCIGYAAILFYKENQKLHEQHKKEREETTEKFIQISNESVMYIQENSTSLKELRDDIKEDRHTREIMNERMMSAFENTLRENKNNRSN